MGTPKKRPIRMPPPGSLGGPAVALSPARPGGLLLSDGGRPLSLTGSPRSTQSPAPIMRHEGLPDHAIALATERHGAPPGPPRRERPRAGPAGRPGRAAALSVG